MNGSVAYSFHQRNQSFACSGNIRQSLGLILALLQRVTAQEKHFVYILRSEVDPARHYVGLTADVAQRVAGHNAGQSIHTASRRPWTFVVSIEFQEEPLAARFEHYLKSGSGRAFAKRHFADPDRGTAH